MDEASSTNVNGAGQEGHTDGTLVGYTLKCADEVGPFEILTAD